MANEEIILEASGLTKEFKGFIAVKNVNLRIRRHTIHALIGPNGAGKTTCFNLLTHFLSPTAGQIHFNGRNITGSSPAAIARMGLARSFQISAVFPHLSVRENVRVALQRKLGISFQFWRSESVLGRLDARAMELVDAVGLGQLGRHRLGPLLGVLEEPFVVDLDLDAGDGGRAHGVSSVCLPDRVMSEPIPGISWPGSRTCQ